MGQADLPAACRRVIDALAAEGASTEIKVFDASTRTSADAAATIGCTVAQIAKSLVFRTKAGASPILVVASGVNRVDLNAVAKALVPRLGEDRIVRADADFVRAKTGFAIGGVPPIGHAEPPLSVIDRDLFAFEQVWAAAGTPSSVFATTAATLQAMTEAVVADIRLV